MVRTRLVVAAIALAFGEAIASAQDALPPPAVRSSLPAGWDKLGLTAEQARQVAALQHDYQKELAELEARIVALKRAQQGKLQAVLSEEQRQRLRELTADLPNEGRANAGKRWSAQEAAELLRAFEAGVSIQELANRHQRSEAAIRARLHLLGARPAAPARQP